MSNDRDRQLPFFPAIEELIGRLPQRELFAISGFVILLHQKANELVDVMRGTAYHNKSTGANEQSINTALALAESILSATNRISYVIGNRFAAARGSEHLGEDESYKQLKDRLRQAFPDLDI